MQMFPKLLFMQTVAESKILISLLGKDVLWHAFTYLFWPSGLKYYYYYCYNLPRRRPRHIQEDNIKLDV